MTSLRIPAAMALLLPCIAFAQGADKFQCTKGELVRRVEIYTEPGAAAPCEVHYFKDTEAPGDSEVLWSAQADGTYCQTKTTEFVAKLESWGWACQAPQIEPPPPAEESAEGEAADDTESLSPADSQS